MRHPPAAAVAVFRLLVFDKMRVPVPSFTNVLAPARVELIVAVTPVSTSKDAAPAIVTVPALRE
jgi:hypothetical protein